jgi:hypothetical protein
MKEKKVHSLILALALSLAALAHSAVEVRVQAQDPTRCNSFEYCCSSDGCLGPARYDACMLECLGGGFVICPIAEEDGSCPSLE